MIISEHHKYIFLAVPKTGSTSVERCLLQHDATAIQNRVRVGAEDVAVGPHISALELRRILGDSYHKYRSFAFVRHPFSRGRDLLRSQRLTRIEVESDTSN